MINETQEHIYRNEGVDVRRKISWASIWAGMLVGVILLILLNFLGLGIGFSSLDFEQERTPASGLGIGAGIWYFISSIIALFTAGWVSGRLAQTRHLFDGALHGILTWCLVTFVTIYFLTTSIGNIIGGVGSLVGNTLTTVGRSSGQILQMAAPSLNNAVQGVDLSEFKGNSKEVVDMMQNANGDPAKIDHDQLATIIMQNSDKSREEATRNADSLINKYTEVSAKWQNTKEEIKEKAPEVADNVASAASATFIIAFFVFIIGGIAAAFGAKMGTESKSNPHYERVKTTIA